MIQRIQSLFLLAATIFSIIVVFHPISSMILKGGTEAELYTYGLMTTGGSPTMLYNTFPIIILAIITGILNIIIILIYKRRNLQMRLCVFNILLTLGLLLSMFGYYFLIKKNFDVVTHSFSYSVVLPFVNIILIFQAFRGIRRDDLLLKSYNRLRD